jgi:hypothetical protein
MGASGPPPKRSDQRRRANKPVQPVVKAPGKPAVQPASDPDWHPIARMWFESLGESGQSVFYQSSDWLSAYAIAESMSREFAPQPMVVGSGPAAHVEMVTLPPKAASLAAWLKGMSGLLVLEGDRRRVQLELERTPVVGKQEAASVSSLDSWRTRIDGTG